MDDAGHLLRANRPCSAGRSSPLSANMRMGVSRLSTCFPIGASGKHVARDLDLMAQAAY